MRILRLSAAPDRSAPASLLRPAPSPAIKAEFKKIADNVYAFIGRRNDANALVVVTSQGVVLVDTGNDPPQTRILQNFIKSVTDQPVRYVIITQNHADHIGGTGIVHAARERDRA